MTARRVDSAPRVLRDRLGSESGHLVILPGAQITALNGIFHDRVSSLIPRPHRSRVPASHANRLNGGPAVTLQGMTITADPPAAPPASSPGADFAALMSKAASAAAPADTEAPYGYTTDPVTGERRPKLRAGRPRKSPGLDQLKQERAEAEASGTAPAPPEADRPPSSKGPKPAAAAADPKADRDHVPQFREGQIARGVNRLYRKAGRIVRVMDPEIGQAIIEVTRKDFLDDGVTPDPEDITVGEAWENVARGNVRIRRLCLKVIATGAIGELVMAHGPILLAVMMKDRIRRFIPFAGLLQAFLAEDDDGQAGDDDGEASASSPNQPGPVPGLTSADLDELRSVAETMAAQIAARTVKRTGTPAARARPSSSEPAGAYPRPGP
jgi:hypothetical protein